jgi:hypothetical protein
VAHAVHYDLIVHTARRNSSLQAYAAFGGGMKLFDGTGTPAAYQPTEIYGYMTQATDVKPMASVGGGISLKLSPRFLLRIEARDFITPFPTKVITPPSNAVKYGSILNDIVPMVGLEYVFSSHPEQGSIKF